MSANTASPNARPEDGLGDTSRRSQRERRLAPAPPKRESRRRALRITSFLGGKILSVAVVLLIIAAVTFFAFTLLPNNVSLLSCGRPCTPERMDQVRTLMGYDQPIWRQFLTFLGGIVAGRTFGTGGAAVHCAAPCFGYSFQRAETVNSLIMQALPVTLSIAIGAAVLALLFGTSTGVLAALKPRSIWDRILLVLSITGVSAPAYLVGMLAILFFGFFLDIIPVGGYVPLTQDPLGWLWHLILPWMTLAFLSAAIYTRLARTQVMETLGENFIRTGRAIGLSERRLVGVHVLRNTALPILTVFGLELGSLLAGAVITEKVFSMPGIGSLMIDAVGTLDLPVLLGVTVFSAFAVVLINLLVDLLYGLLDPRTLS